MEHSLNGFAGAILDLDLSAGSWAAKPLDEATIRDYLGGTGYAARLLYDLQPAGTDPLGAEAAMVIATGPLTRNEIPGGGSVELCFRSPLTGAWGESRAGGDFGPDLRRAGFDHLLIRGRSEKPVYALIRDGKLELRSAAALVGKRVSEKLAILRAEPGVEGASIACIGLGGVACVRFASVMFGDRAAGRCGAGAVLGAKNLLAIAVQGKKQVPVARPEELKQTLRRLFPALAANPVAAGFHACGTIGDLAGNDAKGDWPTKNWQSNSWGEGIALYDAYEKRNFLRPYPCYRGCTIACGRKVRVPDGAYATPEHGGAEYESISCFTAYMLNGNMDAAIHASWLCNEYGIDTISAGAVIAFAIECAQAGLLHDVPIAALGAESGTHQAADPPALTLDWGRPGILAPLLGMIATRHGLGDILADGVKRAAERIGGGAEAFAVHVKGLEGPAHDGRSGKALALSYGTGNRGMCHIHPAEAMAWDSGKLDWGLRSHGLPDPAGIERWAETGKGAPVKLIQDALNLPDILGTCKFFMYAGVGVDELADLLSSVTGRDIGPGELLSISERSVTLQRLFNLREGFTAEDDRLPDRACAQPAFGRYHTEPECAIADFPAMLREYYEARGWDAETGMPGTATLERLGLGPDAEGIQFGRKFSHIEQEGRTL